MKQFEIVDKIKSFKFDHYKDGRIFRSTEFKNGKLIEKKNISELGEPSKLNVEGETKDKNQINKKILDLLERIRLCQKNGSINNSICNTKLFLHSSYYTNVTGTNDKKLNILEIEFEYDEKYRSYFEKILNSVTPILKG